MGGTIDVVVRVPLDALLHEHASHALDGALRSHIVRTDNEEHAVSELEGMPEHEVLQGCCAHNTGSLATA